VKGSISIQIEKFIPWAQAHADERGWINLDVKESKGGKIYCEVSSWKPNRASSEREDREFDRKFDEQTKAETNSDDMPF
ncbi:MAG: hypothetical protein KGJ13_12335, partial [Patescibacteria group bacterium]|nr:hypothetical protein [Patescibacteria group bacterium]